MRFTRTASTAVTTSKGANVPLFQNRCGFDNGWHVRIFPNCQGDQTWDYLSSAKMGTLVPLQGLFFYMGKAGGVIISGVNPITAVKVWRGRRKSLGFHGLNLKNMNVLPKSDDNKIRFSGKYLDLQWKGAAQFQQRRRSKSAMLLGTARLNITGLTSLQVPEGLHYPKLVRTSGRIKIMDR